MYDYYCTEQQGKHGEKSAKFCTKNKRRLSSMTLLRSYCTRSCGSYWFNQWPLDRLKWRSRSRGQHCGPGDDLSMIPHFKWSKMIIFWTLLPQQPEQQLLTDFDLCTELWTQLRGYVIMNPEYLTTYSISTHERVHNVKYVRIRTFDVMRRYSFRCRWKQRLSFQS